MSRGLRSPQNWFRQESSMVFDQAAYEVCCEWGRHGVELLSPNCDVVVVVDVLSFSTSVDIAVGRGAQVFPFTEAGDEAVRHAASVGGVLAGSRRAKDAWTLSPTSLLGIPPGTRLVLPSPNGATLSLSVRGKPVLAGCLRNAAAIAARAKNLGGRVAVIPAGERWPDQSLRVAAEDLVGAGAILSHWEAGQLSPEARIAVAAFQSVKADLQGWLGETGSGRELQERGFEQDVREAARLDCSACAPILVEGAYQAGQDD